MYFIRPSQKCEVMQTLLGRKRDGSWSQDKCEDVVQGIKEEKQLGSQQKVF